MENRTPKHRSKRRDGAAAASSSRKSRSHKKPIFGDDNRYRYRLVEQIGSGSFGVVYLAERREDQKQVAIKCVSLGMDEDARRELKALRNEVQILRSCHDPFVVKYYESFIVEKTRSEETWIVMEFCDFGTLENLRKMMEDGCITDHRLVRIVVAGVTLGLLYLHNKNMIHRDIKGGNVLLSCSGGCKLADFGVSAQMSNTTLSRSTLTGTPMFMAPEVIQQKPYTQAADVWSLGILIYEMLEGELPFSHFKNPMTAMMRIPHMKAPRLPEPERFDPKVNNFINHCLQKKPLDRCNTTQLAEHPLVRSYARELRKNGGVSPYLGNFLREKIKEMMLRRRKKRSSAAETTPPPPPPSDPPPSWGSEPPPPPTPPSPMGDGDNGTMIGPAAGTFGEMFATANPSKATFIEHAGPDLDTMAPQFSDTMMEIDSPTAAMEAHSSDVEPKSKYSNGSFKGSQNGSFKKNGSYKGSANGSFNKKNKVQTPSSKSALSRRQSCDINFAKLKNPILVMGQSSVTKVAHLLNTIPSNAIKIGDTECVVVYSERKKGYYTCDRESPARYHPYSITGADGVWLAGHRCRVRKDAQLTQVRLDTS